MYIRQEALWQSIRLVLEGCGFESLASCNFFHFFVTLLAADYKLTNNSYNECLYEIFTKSHEKRRKM